MPSFEINLKCFEFPQNLKDEYANFRFAVELRFFNASGKLVTKETVIPSLETFWECDTGEQDAQNYVRATNDDGKSINKFDMNKIGVWDSLIFHIPDIKRLHSIKFTVFDVNREDIWNKAEGLLGKTVGTAFDVVTGSVFKKLPSALSSIVKSDEEVMSDLESALIKKITGGDGDKILFRKSKALDEINSEDNLTLTGKGKYGDYAIGIEVKEYPE